MKIYKCPVCGNVIEKLYDSSVPVVCCGKPMEELKAGVTDAALEKHVPVCEVKDGRLTVKVGSVEHPMTKEHHIAFIIAKAGDIVMRKELTPEDKPVAEFCLNGYKGNVEVYEYCNLHGLWKTDITA